jgi:hypothetical protein
MKVIVKDNDGVECFLYDTNKDSMCLGPARSEVPGIVEALREATKFLSCGMPDRLGYFSPQQPKERT